MIIVENERSVAQRHKEITERAKAYMNACFKDNITLNEIANHCNVSTFHFCRIFKQFENCTPYQYLLQLRLRNAEVLLLNTSNSITEICFSSGFNSLEHFATFFRSRYSKNPTEFRRQCNGFVTFALGIPAK